MKAISFTYKPVSQALKSSTSKWLTVTDVSSDLNISTLKLMNTLIYFY